jgi:hypothetical protein
VFFAQDGSAVYVQAATGCFQVGRGVLVHVLAMPPMVGIISRLGSARLNVSSPRFDGCEKTKCAGFGQR